MANTDTAKTKTMIDKEHRDWLDNQITVTACYLCNVDPFVGPASEGRVWALQHRLEHHPDAARSPRRRLTSAEQKARAIERSEWRREDAA